jgi:hypothetical protein
VRCLDVCKCVSGLLASWVQGRVPEPVAGPIHAPTPTLVFENSAIHPYYSLQVTFFTHFPTLKTELTLSSETSATLHPRRQYALPHVCLFCAFLSPCLNYLFRDCEDGGSAFLRNISKLIPDYTPLILERIAINTAEYKMK